MSRTGLAIPPKTTANSANLEAAQIRKRTQRR
jgi:hypothetical protein